MANDVLVAEPEVTAPPAATSHNSDPALEAWRAQLAEAVSEPDAVPTRGDRFISILGWVLYAAAMLAVLRALWAVGDTISRMLGR